MSSLEELAQSLSVNPSAETLDGLDLSGLDDVPSLEPPKVDKEALAASAKAAQTLLSKFIGFKKELASSKTEWDPQQVSRCKVVLGAAKTLVDFPGIRGHDDYLNKGAAGNEDDDILSAFIGTVSGITDELIVKMVAVLNYLDNHDSALEKLTPERAKTLIDTFERVDGTLSGFEAKSQEDCDKIIEKYKMEELMSFGKENLLQNAGSINRALFKLSEVVASANKSEGSNIREELDGKSYAHGASSKSMHNVINLYKALTTQESGGVNDEESSGIRTCPGFEIEVGFESIETPPRPLLVAEPERYRKPYGEKYFAKPHFNFLGTDAKDGPLALSIRITERRTTLSGSEEAVAIALLRSRRGEFEDTYRIPLKKSGLDVGQGEALKHYKKVINERYALVAFQYVPRAELDFALKEYEDKLFVTRYKFGILYVTGDQGTNEDEMYSNRTGSDRFEHFLTRLGTKVAMQGWQKYRAGLDTIENATGPYSIYTEWRGFEIMFHVSTYLPYSEVNPQQVERKRHLGNDIVILVFHDGKGVFDPSCIRSHFNHVFIIVRPVFVEGEKTPHYKVSVVYKGEVLPFLPRFPKDYIFEEGEYFREFVLTKLINAENSSLRTSQFTTKSFNTKKDILLDITDKYMTKTK